MFQRKALLGGVAGGALGAVLWAVVASVTGYEVGWIAWAVGGMVGYGVAWGNGGSPSSAKASGVLAVAITLLAIPTGKYLGLQFTMPGDEELIELLLEGTRNDEYTVSYLADEVVEERTLAGEQVGWPMGVDPEMASAQVDYPADVWVEALERWASMAEGEQADFRSQVQDSARANLIANLPEIRAAISMGAFLYSFGPMDLIFFGLALVTAFGVAGGKKKERDEAAATLVEAVKLAMLKVALADGEIRPGELRAIGGVHAGLTGVQLSDEEIRAEISREEPRLADLPESFQMLAPTLTDQGKALILSGATRVAAADGEFSDAEKATIYTIASALGLDEEELQTLLVGSLEESRA